MATGNYALVPVASRSFYFDRGLIATAVVLDRNRLGAWDNTCDIGVFARHSIAVLLAPALGVRSACLFVEPDLNTSLFFLALLNRLA